MRRSRAESDGGVLLPVSGAKRSVSVAGIVIRRLHPRNALSNPVLFATEIAAVVATLLFLGQQVTANLAASSFIGQVAGWLWLTVCCAGLVEVIAEGRRVTRTRDLRTHHAEEIAKRLRTESANRERPTGESSGAIERVPAGTLRPEDVILVEAGDTIPVDGEVIEGIAEVDESPITGESAPVIRESGGERSTVIGGTRVISDRLKVRVTAQPGDSFLDHISSLVEETRRLRSSRQGRISIALAGIALLATTLYMALAAPRLRVDVMAMAVMAVALFAALLPVASAASAAVARLGSIGRLLGANIVAKSAEAIEAAGRVDTVLLDKTGTITFGHRQAVEFLPLSGVTKIDLSEAAWLASLGDETPEGRSIVALAEKILGKASFNRASTPIPFSADSRMSGARLENGRELWKGSPDAVLAKIGVEESDELRTRTQLVAGAGGTPLLVTSDRTPLGVVRLEDVVKPGLRNRFAQLRRLGIRTIMITGDNPLTAATVAAEAGVDAYVARATPASKLEVIRGEQTKGNVTAMCGDGVNDAPALRQADVGLAMGAGAAAAREAGNMIDLDNDPLKLMEVIRIGSWITRRRRALGALALANDVGKYAVLAPALLATHPALAPVQVLGSAAPHTAILSTIIFNALAVFFSLSFALYSPTGTPRGGAEGLGGRVVVLAVAGFLAPILGIPLIERALTALHLASPS